MPSRIRLRRVFKPLVTGLAKGLNRIGLTPNLATLVMFMCSLASFLILIFFENYFWFGIMVFITGIFDGIDGSIARLSNSATKFGGFFDSFTDRLSEFMILLAL
ncbi:MAG: CDP-alcohol phosphatidyltransferase family protein, partial [Promethearchaeota archaeon]